MTTRERMAERSPLDDYFREVDGKLEGTNMASMLGTIGHQPDEDEWGNETLVNAPASPLKGWTGPQQTLPGPSLSNPNPTNSTDTTDNTLAFAERFKYIVCSSGLLEKDFVTSAGDGSASVPQETAMAEVEVVPIETRQTGESSVWASIEWGWWLRMALVRWDISLAAFVLVGAVGVVVGWSKLLVTLACLAGGMGAAEVWQRQIPLEEVQLLTNPPTTQPTPAPSSLPVQPSPRASALSSLQSLLSSSASLDITLSTSLAQLSSFRGTALQSTLHHLCSEMTDHIATASSSLQGLVDGTEMRILGEMYDIPLDGRPRQRISDLTQSSGFSVSASVSASDKPIPSPTRRYTGRYPIGLGVVPSPRRRLDSAPSTIRPLRSIPDSPSAGHKRHARHLSLLPSDIPSDHFTSIPQRTPRLAKRASWDIGHKRRFSRGTGEESGLLAAWKLSEPLKRSGSRTVVHEKRITEADEDGDVEWSSTSGEDLPTDTTNESEEDQPVPVPTSSNGLRILSLPSSPTLSSPRKTLHTPKHTSPLAGHMHTPTRPSTSLTESAIRLAALSYHSPISQSRSLTTGLNANPNLNISPPTDNPKRRSLGNMPYCHAPSSPLVAYGSHGMSRTRSLQSDLQDARARSATGSRSRRTSMSLSTSSVGNTLPPIPIPFPRSPSMALRPAQPHRIPSVSPLTTPALQAACLGVHLKRRRVACALLALRWDEANGYWGEVREVLDTLKEGIEGELLKLKEIKQDGMGDSDRSRRLTPPWSIIPDGPQSFAPIISAKEKMEEHVRVVQLALGRAWEETVMVQRHLDGGTKGEVQSWGGLREELGIMIREVERGKETMAKMDPDPPNYEPAPPDPTDTIPPPFLQTWEDDNLTHRSTSDTTTSTDILSPDPGDDEDSASAPVLAPAGADEVYEADLCVVDMRRETGLGKMSREERVGMMRLAREKGLTLGEYLRRSQDSGEGSRGEEKREREEGGRKVVDELKGVIGLIRDKKLDLAAEKRTKGRLDDQITVPSTVDAQSTRVKSTSLPLSVISTDNIPSSGPFSRLIRPKSERTAEDTRSIGFGFEPDGESDSASRRAIQDELRKAFGHPAGD